MSQTVGDAHLSLSELSTIFAAGGEMGALMTSRDWSQTALGPVTSWPASLRSALAIMLGTHFPMMVGWGRDLLQLYNDGFRPILGAKHPTSLAQPCRECWPEIWDQVGPLLVRILNGEGPIWEEAMPLEVNRRGFVEETHFTFCYSPIPHAGSVGGVLVTVHEVTNQVQDIRQLSTLRELAARSSEAKTDEQACQTAASILAANAADVTFALIYLLEADGQIGKLAASAGFGVEHISGRPGTLSVSSNGPGCWPLAKALNASRALVVDDLPQRFGRMPGGKWPAASHTACMVPLRRSGTSYGVLITGLSPRRTFDDRYRGFIEMAADEVGAAIATARAYQEERRRAEALAEVHRLRTILLSERERLRVAFNKAALGMAILDFSGRFLDVNEAFCGLTGYTREELLACTSASIIHADDRQRDESLCRELQAGRISEFVIEERYLRKNGEVLWIRNNVSIVRSAGENDTMITVSENVSARKQAEEERQALLQRELAARGAAEHALRAAEQANRAKDEFLAMLGHELRNPLSPIVTALRIMQLRGDHNLARERQIIERQVTLLTQLLDDLLDISRMTRGKIRLTKGPVELAEIIATGIEMASPMLEQRQHHLELDIESNGLVLNADPMRLAQVIFNLLTNAAKYSDIGGRSVLSARREGDEIVLRVHDNGIGIAPPLLVHVFDLFQQGPRELDRAQGGLGVGLTIVRNLVELHGGSVSVWSEGVGKGSEFVVRLPAIETAAMEAAGAAEVAPVSQVPNAEARRVLIVDDNEDAAEMLAELLQHEGYVTRYVYDAPSALDIVRDFAPDVILIDIGLPVMNGYELARRLRKMPGLASSTLIALTGYGQEADRRRALESGFNEHLVKPLDFSQLWRVLQAPEARPAD